ncbi:MAG: hypothetical protein PHX83_04170 [Acidobacteriia bacterium]|nr:hypothetical protein [Terriglobia bacterium]
MRTRRFWFVDQCFGVMVAALFFLPGIVPAQESAVDLTTLVQETQKMSKQADTMKLAWWIPEEFWKVSFAQDATISPAQVEGFLKVLRPYMLVVAVDGQIGSLGGVSFKPEATIRETTQLLDSSGVRYHPVGDERFEPDLRNFLQMVKPVLSNMMGPLGQNMHFLLFPARNAKGLPIADARKEGSFSIQVNDSVFKWHLPLGSLIPQKTCPVDGEKLDGAWTFCPWHGARLVSALSHEQKPAPK